VKTQLPFAEGDLYARPDPEEAEKLTLDDVLPSDVGFQEAVAQTKSEIARREYALPHLPGLTLHHRVPIVPHPAPARLSDLKATPHVRAWYTERFPEWKSVTPQGDWLRFRKPLSEQLDILVIFAYERVVTPAKRAFTLSLGVEIKKGKMKGWRWEEPLLALYQMATYFPYWSFRTREELEQALPTIAFLLQSVLPVLEANLRHWLCPLPQNVRDAVVQRDAVTAQDVYEEARRIAHHWSPQAKLVGVKCAYRNFGVANSSAGYAVRYPIASGIDSEGRLMRYGYWLFQFTDDANQWSNVHIPAIGSARCDLFSYPLIPTAMRLPEGWIDSAEAMRLAEAQDEYKAYEQADRCLRSFCRLTSESNRLSQPHWEVSYQFRTERGQKNLILYLDAYTGEPLRVMKLPSL
jgi:hypothetical protein